MRRREALKSIAAAAAAAPLAAVHLRAQAADITPADIATLRAIAEIALPSSIGPGGRDDAVRKFVAWVRGYRPGADRGHGYGNSQLQSPTGPSPAARYPAQFVALDAAARSRGGASFASLSAADRRLVVEAALSEPARITQLPARPTGANLVADFLGLYFNSADARDVAYRAAIERDTCRGLDGSDQPPRPLGTTTRSAGGR